MFMYCCHKYPSKRNQMRWQNGFWVCQLWKHHTGKAQQNISLLFHVLILWHMHLSEALFKIIQDYLLQFVISMCPIRQYYKMTYYMFFLITFIKQRFRIPFHKLNNIFLMYINIINHQLQRVYTATEVDDQKLWQLTKGRTASISAFLICLNTAFIYY